MHQRMLLQLWAGVLTVTLLAACGRSGSMQPDATAPPSIVLEPTGSPSAQPSPGALETAPTRTPIPSPTSAPSPTASPTATPAPFPVNVEARNMVMVGQVGGAIKAVAAHGHYVYLGEGPRLTILDVSEPSSPTLVGRTSPLPAVIEDIDLSQDTVYAAVGAYGIRVVDVSDPTTPQEVGDYDTPGFASEVDVVGNWAYVADGDALRVLDVSRPHDPIESSSFAFEPQDGLESSLSGMAAAQGYVYLTGEDSLLAGDGMPVGYGWVRILKIDSPARPEAVGQLSEEGDLGFDYPWDVAVAGDTAYVLWGKRLQVLDVSERTRPIEVGGWNAPPGCYLQSLALSQAADRLHVGGEQCFSVLDVSDPAAPTELASYPVAQRVSSILAGGDLLYTGVGGTSLQIVDVSDPSSPREIGEYSTLGQVTHVAVGNGVILVLDGQGDLHVFDVSRGAEPYEIGSYEFPGIGGAYDLALVGDYGVFVGYRHDAPGLSLLDLSDPAVPLEVGFLQIPGGVSGVVVASDEMTGLPEPCVFVAAGRAGLRVVDLSNPAHPTEVSYCDAPTDAQGVAVSGTRAYVADGWSGLRVIDVSEPASLTELVSHATEGYVYDVEVGAGYVYVIDGETGLQAVPMSGPGTLTALVTGTVNDVSVHEGHAYVTAGGRGVEVLDLGTPPDPHATIAFYDTPGCAYGATVEGSDVYVADGPGGLVILRFLESGARAPLPAASSTPEPTPRPDGTVIHLVEEGDTFTSIALRYGVSVEQLWELNGLGPSSLPRVGQELTISVPRPISQDEPDSRAQDAPLWAMYRHDAQRSGGTEAIGPGDPVLTWVYHGEGVLSAPVAAADGRVYLDAGGGNLRGLDPSGSETWSYSLPGSATSRLALGQDGVLYAAQRNNLYAVRLRDESIVWTYAADSPIRDLAIAIEGTIYLAGDQVHAINSRNGTRQWVTPIDSCRGLESLAVAPDGLVYAMGSVSVCAYTSAGALRWREATAPGARGLNVAITVDRWRRVYVNGEAGAGARVALPVDSLTVLHPDGSSGPYLRGYFESPPAMDREGTWYASWREIGETVETESGILTAELGPPLLQARSRDGALLRSSPLGDKLCSYPVVGGDGTQYVMLCSGELRAFDGGGNPSWSIDITEAKDYGRWTDWDLAVGDRMVIAASDRAVYGIGEAP